MACYLPRAVTLSPWLFLFLGCLAWHGCADRNVKAEPRAKPLALHRPRSIAGRNNPEGINNMGYNGTRPMGGSGSAAGGRQFGGTSTRPFGGAFDAGPPPMPVGCPSQYNFGLCEITLLQNACVAKHSPSSKGMTAEDACNKVWPKKMFRGPEPMHLYCLAAASDRFLLSKASEVADVVRSDAASCKVANMDHLKIQYGGFNWDPVARIENAERSNLLVKNQTSAMMAQMAMMGGGHMQSQGVDIYVKDLTNKIHKICQEYTKKVPESSDQRGLCFKTAAKAWDPQDCEFYKGIEAAWSKKYGEEACNAFPDPKKFRCLALRKQIIRTAQHKSFFKVAKFTKFGNLTGTSQFEKISQLCPDN